MLPYDPTDIFKTEIELIKKKKDFDDKVAKKKTQHEVSILKSLFIN
jgi:hypothetical protein